MSDYRAGELRVLCCRLRPAERAHFPSHAPSMLVSGSDWRNGVRKSTFALQDSESHMSALGHSRHSRHIGWVHAADVEDEIGFEREHDLEIGGVAAPGDAAHFGPAADVGQEEFAFLRPVGARPADEQLGRERVEKDRAYEPEESLRPG